MVVNVTPAHPDQQELMLQSAPDREYIPSAFQEEGDFYLDGNYSSSITNGYVRIGGATIEFTLERPSLVKDPVPLLIAPGYGGIEEGYVKLRESVVSIGNKPSVTFKVPRSQDNFSGFHPNHLFHPERLLAQAVIAISSNLIASDGVEYGYDKMDTTGHSMGGPAVVNAGLIKPELFRSVTAMASAGLDGHNLVDMAKRGPGSIKNEIIPSIRRMKVKKDVGSALVLAHYVFRNPIRTASEGIAVGVSDIRESVVYLGKFGVKTAALQFPSDRIFPLHGVVNHSSERFNLFRVFPDPEANHVWPNSEPEAVAIELLDIIDNLQNNSSYNLRLVK